jgi:drug/metabolite transporter (DMT)-like permease
MDNSLVFAALLSAALHAAWNAAVKAHPRPPQAMTAQMLASALLAAPVLLWVGLPPPGAWPWMLASSTLGMGAVATLLRAYERGGFGVVYPMARAASAQGPARFISGSCGPALVVRSSAASPRKRVLLPRRP